MNGFNIQLNETTYKIGSQVNGALKILKGGGLSLRDVSINVEGKESTTIIKNENFTNPNSHTSQTRSVTYREENKFFHLDLSQFIFDAKEIGEQFYEIPFNFILPDTLLPTFQSTNVDISYELTAIWQKKWVGSIKRMWVSRQVRGVGVGRRLLLALEKEAAALGMRLLRLETNRTLHEAQALYRRNGYREVPAFNDDTYADHWFEKRNGASDR